jgi:membrane fusion protein, multidrug efflux system
VKENHMKKVNTTAYLTVLQLAILAAITGCDKPVEPPSPPRPALVMVVGDTASLQGMVLVGEVKSRFESNQGFRVNGKIIERKVDVGALVKKGQLLARLDASDAQLAVSASAADVRAAQVSYSLALNEVERQRQLVNKKFISASVLDKYEAEVKTAAARVAQARAQAAVSGNQSRYNMLNADRDGVVTKINAEPGQVVQAGEMVAQITDTQQIEVLVAVPESRMSSLKVGNAVEIKLWADREKTYVGKVREIAPAANSATRAFDVKVAMQHDENVKLGMTAGIKFGKSEEVNLIIPTGALTEKNGQKMCWVIDQKGIANPRNVTAGQYTEDGVTIISGLQAGEMVAIAGVHTLVKGQKVLPKVETKP